MAKQKEQPKEPIAVNCNRLGEAIGLSAGAAEKRLRALPDELQSEVAKLANDPQASKMRIVAAFNAACVRHDRAEAEKQKASDSRFDKAGE